MAQAVTIETFNRLCSIRPKTPNVIKWEKKESRRCSRRSSCVASILEVVIAENAAEKKPYFTPEQENYCRSIKDKIAKVA